MTLRAPFPWFGGKSRAAHLVWAAFGDVPNYVEPFAGSLAVLLGRPTPPRIETVNDLDCYLSNFWRAVAGAPEEVAHHADWPVNEADLHARHRWLVGRAEFRERMKHEPDFFDAKIAGWWVWGICQWIGSGWCSAPEWTGRANAGRRARGVLAMEGKRDRDLSGASEWEKRPQLGKGGRGLFGVSEQLPDLGGNGGAAGKGVTASAKDQTAIVAWMLALQERLRRVRVCCGDWQRVLGRSPTECIGLTGVFLDPPYGAGADRDPSLYTHDDLDVSTAVREWALEHGDNPRLRIALCGYEGEHEMPARWQCVPWKANGGYAASAGNHDNRHRERIWFSPACLPVEAAQGTLFSTGSSTR